MKEKARVIQKQEGQSLVKILKTSACSHCDEKCMLADGMMAEDSHEIDEMEVLVNDPLGAEVGNMVELEMGAKPVLFSAFLVYLLPLVAIIAGYFLGSSWLNTFITDPEVAGIFGSGIGFLISFVFLRVFDKKAGSKSYFHPKITKILA